MRQAAARLDRLIDSTCELVAGILVLIEIVILFAGVISRYLLNSPLDWSGELGEVLFLWLLSLGAVIALRRSEHMRMTVIVTRLRPGTRSVLGRLSALVTSVFTGVLVVSGISYMGQQQAITMPTLGIPGSWEIA
ncbi:MAG: TRAP transporter small permease, partial [Acetobacteraceae bacterium]